MTVRTKDARVRFKVETGSAEKSIRSFQTSFTELNQALELGGKVFSGFSAIATRVGQTLERGFKVNNLTKSFEQLNKAAGVDAAASLRRLQEATQGLLSDTEILTQANEALTIGLDPKTFEQVTEAATKLSLSMGKDVTQGVNSVVVALGRQSREMLDNLGVQLSITEAQEEYAKRLGTTADALSEADKASAFSVIASERLIAKSKEIADVTADAGLEYQKLTVSYNNLLDRFSAGIAKNDNLARSLAGIRAEIDNINVDALVNAFAHLLTTIPPLIRQLENLAQGINVIFEGQAGAAASNFEQQFRREAAAIKASIVTIDQKKAAVKRYTEQIAKDLRTIREYEARHKALTTSLRFASSSTKEQREEAVHLEATIATLNKRYEVYQAGLIDLLKDEKQQTEQLNETTKSVEKLGSVTTSLVSSPKTKAQYQADLKQALEEYKKQFEEKSGQAAEAAAEEHRRQFEESAAFFEDLIFDSLNNGFRSFEDIGKKILADVAASFLAELTGAGTGGIEDVGKNLGQSLAQALTGDGGGGGGGGGIGGLLGNLFGGSSGGAAQGPLTQGGSFLESLGIGRETALGLGDFASNAGATAGISFAVSENLSNFQNALNGGTDAQVEALGTAIGTGIGAFVAGPIGAGVGAAIGDLAGGFIGDQFGPSRVSREQDLRESTVSNILDKLEEITGRREFQTNFGGVNLDPSNFNVDFGSGSLAEQLVPSTSALATLLSGGTGKLKDDLTGIFANALGEASSFDAALLNLSTVFDQLGLSVDDAKEQFKNLFLDGELSLEEFGAGVQNLNMLATENLTGTGSVSSALQLLADSVDNPRAQLKALELLFGELQEIGVTSVSGIGTALTDQLGPEAVEVFSALEAAGITSFENLENKSADEVFFIINQVRKLDDELADVFTSGFAEAGESVAQAAQDVKRGTDDIVASLNNVNKAARNASDQIRNLNLTRVRAPQDLNENLGL